MSWLQVEPAQLAEPMVTVVIKYIHIWLELLRDTRSSIILAHCLEDIWCRRPLQFVYTIHSSHIVVVLQ